MYTPNIIENTDIKRYLIFCKTPHDFATLFDTVYIYGPSMRDFQQVYNQEIYMF